MIIWHNGTFINDTEFSFSLNDRVRYGDGIFDTMLCVDGKPIFAQDHLDRFYSHAHILKIPVTFDEDEILNAAHNVIKANSLHKGHAVLNIILSRGVSPRGLMPPEDMAPEMIIRVIQAPTQFPPVYAKIVKNTRRNEISPLSQIKSFNYGDAILGLVEAKENQANEAIFLNSQDRLACASTSNVYILCDGKLLTPPLTDGAMDGIIRKKLIESGYAKEHPLTTVSLESMEGLFLSNSIRGLFPVITLDGKTLPLAKSPTEDHFHTKIRN